MNYLVKHFEKIVMTMVSVLLRFVHQTGTAWTRACMATDHSGIMHLLDRDQVHTPKGTILQ